MRLLGWLMVRKCCDACLCVRVCVVDASRGPAAAGCEAIGLADGASMLCLRVRVYMCMCL